MARRFRVEVAEQTERDVVEIRDFIARDKPRAASKWAQECRRRIRGLSFMPERYEVVPEIEHSHPDVRHIIFGNYRILFRVESRRVVVLRVVHAARLLGERFWARLLDRGGSAEHGSPSD